MRTVTSRHSRSICLLPPLAPCTLGQEKRFKLFVPPEVGQCTISIEVTVTAGDCELYVGNVTLPQPCKQSNHWSLSSCTSSTRSKNKMDLHFFDSNFNVGFYYVTLVGSRRDLINGNQHACFSFRDISRVVLLRPDFVADFEVRGRWFMCVSPYLADERGQVSDGSCCLGIQKNRPPSPGLEEESSLSQKSNVFNTLQCETVSIRASGGRECQFRHELT